MQMDKVTVTLLSTVAALLLITLGAQGALWESRSRVEVRGITLVASALALSCMQLDVGEHVYLRDPEAILDAIRTAEGVPSYGVMPLAHRYGRHQLVPESLGRAAAAQLLRGYYRAWVQAGRPQTFLEWTAARWAPVGAANDPMNLNANFLSNVLAILGWSEP